MPRGGRAIKNPFEKLILQYGQIENTIQAIIDSAEKPDFVSSIVSLKQKMEDEASNKSKLNDDAREVLKLLQTYPGLSKSVLAHLRSKISEYKSLGILDKYKSDPEPQEKSKRDPK